MKENKEETKLQSEQKTAEEIHPDVAAWNKFKAENKESFRADTVTHDRYLENRLWAAFFAGRDHAASQFKSQLPIEQKAVDNWKDAVNKAATSFVENHKDEAVRSMFGHHFRTFVQGAIWQQEFDSKSQPLPIEGVEREQFSVEDLEAAFNAGQAYDYYIGLRTWYASAQKRPNFKEWLATRKGSTSGK